MNAKILSLVSLLMLLMTTSHLRGQSKEYNINFQIEYFFGNHPNPRAEALGRADVSVGGAISSLFSNPATIGLVKDWQTDWSTSAPFFLERQADYFWGGYARRVHDKVVVAISGHHLASGEIPGFGVDVNGTNYPVDKPQSTDLTLTAAAELVEGLHIGVNANLFSWKLFDEVKRARAPRLDVGLLYELPLSDASTLRAGASLNNALFSSLTYQAPDGNEASPPFPVVGRAGLTFEQRFAMEVPGAGEQPFQFLVTVEGQTLLNNPFRNTLRAGAELVIANFLALRGGAFTYNWEGQPGGSGLEPRPRISDLTQGFGIILPVDQFTDNRFPVTLYLDYCSLKQPPFAFSTQRFPNQRTFGFRIVSDIDGE